MRCQKCNRDITDEKFIFHSEDGDYCYECRQELIKPIVKQKRRKSPVKQLIKNGYKPTEIAEMLNMTLEEVIEERYR